MKLKCSGALRATVRRILVLDDDRDALVSITNVLRAEFPELEILVAASTLNARQLASQQPFDLVLANERLVDGLPIPYVALRKPVQAEDLVALVRDARP